MLLNREDSLLLLVDFQERLRPAMHEADESIRHMANLAQAAKLLEIPVLASEQNPDKLGRTVGELASHVGQAFSKSRFSAGNEPTLTEAVSTRRTVIIGGWETHVCVAQTALELKAKGLHAVVVADAVSSRSTENRDTALRRLTHHGVEVVASESVLFEWMDAHTHPAFRDIARLIK